MKRRSFLVFFVGLWGVAAFSQSMCIPPALKTHAVRGYVLWKSDGKPMSGMTVELLKFDQSVKVADTQSDSSGFFEVSYPGPGRYWLRTKNDQIPGLTVEIRVEGKEAPHKGKQDFIHFLLSLDPQKYCWGSSVTLIRSDRKDAESKRIHSTAGRS